MQQPLPDAALVERFAAIVGERGVITGEAARPHGRDYRKLIDAPPLLVVKPRTTDEVSRCLRVCHELHLPVVPQGGNTGLTGAGVPTKPDGEVVINLGRMNRIRGVDPENFALAADAGVVLADVQRTAAEAGLFFPLSYGAEGSCMIGGAVATNAGGNAVLRYGNTRDLVLGLEAVLPDGTVLDMMRALRKDNSGPDLKQLFIGSEGLFGVVTGVALKLYPKPVLRETALLAFDDLDKVMAAFSAAREASADRLTAFELMPRNGIALACDTLTNVRDPLEQPHPWYALIEMSSSRPDDDLAAVLEQLLTRLVEREVIVDGVVAASEEQRRNLWRLREGLVEAHNMLPRVLKHDVSVPVSSMASFIPEASAAVRKVYPEAFIIAFGHVGDGNVHFNVCQDRGRPEGELAAREHDVEQAVFSIVRRMNGSFSAEHGVGRLKREHMADFRTPAEMALLRGLKGLLDPLGLMNPGKVL